MDELDSAGPEAVERCECKVGRSAREYGLVGLNEKLGRRHADGASLRDLERFVNESILRRALHDANVDVLGDVSSIYRSLTDDAVSAGTRTETREQLARAGLDVEAVTDDFVTYQTVRTHLRECLDVETGRRETLSTEDAQGTIEWARSRSQGIIERTLERLRTGGQLAGGEFDVTHVTRVTCVECGETYHLDGLVEQGGCDCVQTD